VTAQLNSPCGDRSIEAVLDERDRVVTVIGVDQLDMACGPQMRRTDMEHSTGGARLATTRKNDADRASGQSLHVPFLPYRSAALMPWVLPGA
jgi:hypothetical protein